MPFGLNISGLTTEVKTRLGDAVTRALQSAPKKEHDNIKAAGQILHWKLSAVPERTLIEINCNGNIDPSTNEESFVMTYRAKDVSGTSTAPAAPTPWDPSQGPLVAGAPTPAAAAAQTAPVDGTTSE
jgi:hypothetical protein